MGVDLPQEFLERAEALGARLEVIESSPAYVNAMLAMSQYQKDNFEMLDRSLSMMQAVHNAELQNNTLYVDIIKFMAPIFATATITGATIDTPGLNSSVLMLIGGIGLIASIVMLIPLLIQRRNKAKRQNAEYIKLAAAFDGWRQVAELRDQLRSDANFNPEKAKELFADVMKLANAAKEAERK